MTAIHKFLIGMIALAVLGYVGLYTSLLPQAGTDQTVARLQTAATDRLEEAGIDWARVRMDGQKAVIEGTAPSREAIEAASDVVLHSTWSGGLATGGITAVDTSGTIDMSSILEPSDSASTVPTASPYTWRAVSEGGRVLLSGYVPSENIRLRIINRAGAFFPDGVIDELQIAQGIPAGDWTGAVLTHLAALAMLDRGEANATDSAFTLSGEAGTATAATSARNRLARIDPVFSSEVTVDEAIAPAPEAETPERSPAPPANVQEEVYAATTEAARACQTALNVIMRSNTINFRSASAVIVRDSQPVLNDVAAILRRCQNFLIEIAGHTDATGDAEENLRLSQQRAEAVLTHLASQRVPTSRINAQGYGEARPIAPNETAAGRAQNRRIEFTIIESNQE